MKCVGTLTKCPYTAGGRSRRGSPKAGTTVTESRANNYIAYAELGLVGYVLFRKDIMGRRGGGVLILISELIPAFEAQLQEERDCNEPIFCKLVTGYTTFTIGVVYCCQNVTKPNNETKHNAIREVSKGDYYNGGYYVIHYIAQG